MNTNTKNSLPTINFDKANLNFISNAGIVEKVTKRVETNFHTSSTLTNQSHRVQTTSSNTTVTELWMNDGDRDIDHTLHADISVKESHKICILSTSIGGNKTYYVGLYNFNTGTWQELNSVSKLIKVTGIMSEISGIIFFLLFVSTFLVVMIHPLLTVFAMAGLFYWWWQRNNKRREYEQILSKHIEVLKQILTSTNQENSKVSVDNDTSIKTTNAPENVVFEDKITPPLAAQPIPEAPVKHEKPSEPKVQNIIQEYWNSGNGESQIVNEDKIIPPLATQAISQAPIEQEKSNEPIVQNKIQEYWNSGNGETQFTKPDFSSVNLGNLNLGNALGKLPNFLPNDSKNADLQDIIKKSPNWKLSLASLIVFVGIVSSYASAWGGSFSIKDTDFGNIARFAAIGMIIISAMSMKMQWYIVSFAITLVGIILSFLDDRSIFSVSRRVSNVSDGFGGIFSQSDSYINQARANAPSVTSYLSFSFYLMILAMIYCGYCIINGQYKERIASPQNN